MWKVMEVYFIALSVLCLAGYIQSIGKFYENLLFWYKI